METTVDEVVRLRAELRRLRALHAASSEILFAFDRDGRFRMWGPGSASALEWAEEEVIGRPLHHLLYAEDLRALPRADEPAASTAHRTFRMRHRRGGWRWLDAVVRDLRDDPDVGEVVVNARDVTDAHRAKEDIEGREWRYELGPFAEDAASALIQASTLINTACKVAREQASGGPALLDYLGVIGRGADRMREILWQIMSLSPRVPNVPRTFELNELLSEAREELCARVGPAHPLAFDLASTLLWTRGDREQLRGAIASLLDIACDATPDGRALSLRTQHADDSLVSVSIAVGTRSARRPRLLDTPSRSHPESRTGPSPARNDLSSIAAVVGRNLGAVRLTHAPDGALAITLTLPRAEPGFLAGARDPGPGRVGTVMLVKIDDALAEAVARVLALDGHRVLRAAGPRAAMVCARDHAQVDVVIVCEQRCHALALVEEIRTVHPGVRAVFLTSLSGGVLPGPDDFVLTRPVPILTLCAFVRAAFAATEP